MKKIILLLLVSILTSSLVFSQKTRLGGKVNIGGKNKVGAQAGGGGGGSDFVTDTFTETGSNVNLNLHTGEVGATWTAHGDTATYSNVLNVDATGDDVYALGVAAYYASGTPPSADYYVQATLRVNSVTSNNIAICGRMNTSTNTMYILRYNSGTTWELRKIVAGTATTLRSSTNQLPSAGNTAVMKLVMNGSTISGFINGVEELTAITDTDISAAGKAGIRSAAGDSPATGFHIDDFSAR